MADPNNDLIKSQACFNKIKLPVILTKYAVKKDGKLFLTTEEVEGFTGLNVLIDGSPGGLLVGNYHSIGGIPVLKFKKVYLLKEQEL